MADYFAYEAIEYTTAKTIHVSTKSELQKGLPIQHPTFANRDIILDIFSKQLLSHLGPNTQEHSL